MKVKIYQCPKCKEWVYSRARHDFKQCSCGVLAVDGGHLEDDVLVPETIIGEIKAISKIIILKDVTKKNAL